MKLGLGTGSTAKHFVELLGSVKAGLTVGVPTSEATRADAERCGVPLTTLEKVDRLDLTVDGADEVDPNLELIKGGGGACCARKSLLRPPTVRSLLPTRPGVETLGRFPPIEVIPFGLARRAGVSRPSSPKRRFRANGYSQDEGRPRFRH
jgi:ribose 5-phosphate isomerase A